MTSTPNPPTVPPSSASELPLSNLRKQLDHIDDEIANLLNRRADLVMEVKRTKEKENIDIYSPVRERQILDRVLNLHPNTQFPRAAMERIFSNIISATRSLIGELSVGYVGPEHSLGHEAAVQQFGETLRFLPEPSIEDIFRRVESGELHYGVVPARLPGGGIIGATFDRLVQSELVIIAEIDVRERFSLIGGARALSDIVEIIADAATFARVMPWVRSALPLAKLSLVESGDRAMQLTESRSDAAAIALQIAAERKGLRILASGIQGDARNDARFIVLGRVIPAPTGHDKSTLAVFTPERAGVLRDILHPFAAQGVTLLQIESQPRKQQGFEYVFYLDAVGHHTEPTLKAAIDALEAENYPVRIMGSYPLVCEF